MRGRAGTQFRFLVWSIGSLFLAAAGAAGTGLSARTNSDLPVSDGSVQGRFLVANPDMPDPRFARTVILMVRHDESGALGLVINKPIGYAQVTEEDALSENDEPTGQSASPHMSPSRRTDKSSTTSPTARDRNRCSTLSGMRAGGRGSLRKRCGATTGISHRSRHPWCSATSRKTRCGNARWKAGSAASNGDCQRYCTATLPIFSRAMMSFEI